MAGLAHLVFNIDTPKDCRRKLQKPHKQHLHRHQSSSVHAAVGLPSNRHCLRLRYTGRQLRQAATAAATPETSLTLMRMAVIVLCTSASLLCIATVFLVKKLMHTARKVEDTLDILNEELPGLSASARLTGLELADCIVEFSHLGREVTGGMKAGARAMQATEASLQEGGRALKHTWTNCIVPGFNERVTASKDILDYSIQSNAELTYADRTPAHVAATTKIAIQEARRIVAAMGALYQVASKGLGVLTYMSQSQAVEGSSQGDISHSAGYATDPSAYEEGGQYEQWHPGSGARVDSEPRSSGVWPPVNLQQGAVGSDEGTKDSSGGSSAGMPGSSPHSDSEYSPGGKLDAEGGGPPAPPSH